MRFILVLSICILFIGGLSLYMNQREVQVYQGTDIEPIEEAEGKYSLELVTTFTLEPDPFAIMLDKSQSPPALVIKLRGLEILSVTEQLESGKPVIINPLEGLVTGENELFIEANPTLSDLEENAVRIRIFENSNIISEQTFWTQSGGKIAQTMRFNLSKEEKAQHDH